MEVYNEQIRDLFVSGFSSIGLKEAPAAAGGGVGVQMQGVTCMQLASEREALDAFELGFSNRAVGGWPVGPRGHDVTGVNPALMGCCGSLRY